MRAFISHSSADKKFVHTLKNDLELNGIQTWVDEDQLDYGDSLVEKLQRAIEESSHFLIVLSPNSVDSDWVRLELSKAMLLKDQAILSKIIPIKYRQCEVPTELSKLLYANLSEEVVMQADNNRIKFTTEGYGDFLRGLVRSMKQDDKLLTQDDKAKLKRQVKILEEKADESIQHSTDSILAKRTNVRLYLRVVAFKDKPQITRYKNYFKEKTPVKEAEILSLSDIQPIILPSVVRLYTDDFQIGHEVSIYKSLYRMKAHVSGFRTKSDTYTIVIPGIVRKHLHIEDKRVYLFEFNLTNRSINILDR